MAIEVSCESCGGHFRVLDSAAGKKIRCPRCKGAIDVPAAEALVTTATEVFLPPPLANPRLPIPPEPHAEQWSLKTAEGEEYGPVSRTELDEWFAEGRITAECHVLSSIDRQWQGAASVYPQLNAAVAAPIVAQTKSTGIPTTATDRSQRSRIVASFLGVFLGPLGIHRFYLGYWGIGLAMLFTAGGLGVWSLIDAILVALGRVHDADGRPLSD